MRDLGCFVCSMAGGLRIASRSVAFWGVVQALTMCGRGSYESVLQSVPEIENKHKKTRPFLGGEGRGFCCVAQLWCAVKKISVDFPRACRYCGLLAGSGGLLRGSLLALRCRSLLPVGGCGGHGCAGHVGDHIARVLHRRLCEEARGHAEHHQESGECPSRFLDKVRRLANTEHRVGTRNIRRILSAK